MLVSAKIDGYRLAYKQICKLKDVMEERVEKKKSKVGKAYFVCKGFPIYSEDDLLEMYHTDYLKEFEYNRYRTKLEDLQKSKDTKSKEEYALSILKGVCLSIMTEIKDMEFEALSVEEQTRLLEERNIRAGLKVR